MEWPQVDKCSLVASRNFTQCEVVRLNNYFTSNSPHCFRSPVYCSVMLPAAVILVFWYFRNLARGIERCFKDGSVSGNNVWTIINILITLWHVFDINPTIIYRLVKIPTPTYFIWQELRQHWILTSRKNKSFETVDFRNHYQWFYEFDMGFVSILSQCSILTHSIHPCYSRMVLWHGSPPVLLSLAFLCEYSMPSSNHQSSVWK